MLGIIEDDDIVRIVVRRVSFTGLTSVNGEFKGGQTSIYFLHSKRLTSV